MTKKILTQSYIKELLNYDRDAGVFVWRSARSNIKAGDVAGSLCKTHGYILIGVDGYLYGAHRLAWLYVYGDMPSHKIDHINHNRADNRVENLREATDSLNSKNQSMYRNNTTGGVGITFSEKENKYRARIGLNGKKIHLGRFETLAEAVEARAAAEIKYGYHPNHGN